MKPFTKGFRGSVELGRRVTIIDVARRAEVSASAVSHAFNDPERLRATTVERILGAARDLGYAANPHARALHSRRAGVVGVLVPQTIESVFTNPFFGSFFAGLGRVTDARGIGLLAVSPVATSLERAIATAPVDGFVIVGLDEVHEELAPLRKREVPFVIVDGEAVTVPSVNSDDEAGAFAAASLLLEHGHRDIAVLGFPPATGHHQPFRYGVGGRRHRGIVRAFAEHGATWHDDRLAPTPASLEGGDAVLGHILDSGRRPTALLAVSDVMAIGAIGAARRRGVRVPEDLEVIGFDDIPIAAYTQPALTTVRQPILEKGRIAADLLMRKLDGLATSEQIVLATELIQRESTRPRSRPRTAEHDVAAERP